MFSKGDLLISEPFLNDPNFIRSVILLGEHGQAGSMGFVLNQRSNFTLDDLGKEFENLDFPIYIGGPVEQNTLHFIHMLDSKTIGGEIIHNRLHWSGNMKEMLNLLRLGIIKENQIRFFLGYSGWGRGQLKKEYSSNTWIHMDQYDEEQIFDTDPQQLWRQVLRNKGGKLKELSNYPLDPRLN